MGYEFRLLGSLEALAEGKRIQIGSGKQSSLLAILLLNANEVVPTDRLIEELWRGRPPGTAAKALQVYVSQLRKAMGAGQGAESPTGPLVTESPGYKLDLSNAELDILTFEDRLAKGREALSEGDPGRAAGFLRAALDLWRGPALSDFAYEAFAQGEISRLEALRVEALEDRVEADLQRGEAVEVIGELREIVAAEPLRERPRRQLMLALYRAGRQAEALAVYRDARRALVEELGIEPGKDLRELEAAILAQDPSLDSIQPPERAAAGDESRGALVGREAELAMLGSGLESALAGKGALYLIVGHPGIGKSRLADEVARQARAADATVLVGRCWEAGGAPAYWPWVQSLRSYAEEIDPQTLREQLGTDAPYVAQVVPTLRDLFPDLPEPALEGEGARFRLFDSVARFMSRVAEERPLVIVLDDLHAADEPSLLLLRFIGAELADKRILIVGTFRDVDPTVTDSLASTLAELARGRATHRIELAGLLPEDVARYVEQATGERPGTELAQVIHRETEGNPLFVGEVARLLAAQGGLANVDAHALWSLGVPQGVREVIGRRLSRLSQECAHLLSLASVLGRELEIGALERLSGLHGDELLELLDEAAGAPVLTAVPGSMGRLRFGHALMRQTLYDQLTPPRRVQLHRRAAESLEGLYAQDPEPHLAELAHHFVEAAPGGDIEKAVEYSRRAGDRAMRQLAYEEAARFYGVALQALELRKPVDSVQRCDLLLALGDAYGRAGDTPRAKQTFVEAADVARAAALHTRLGLAALGYGGRSPWLRAGGDPRVVSLLEESLEKLADDELGLRVRLLARLAGALRDEPTRERRAALSAEAVDIARRLDDPFTLGYALVSRFFSTLGPDDDLGAIVAEATSAARRAEDTELMLEVCLTEWWVSMYLGDRERVAAAGAEHRALAQQLGQPMQHWYDAVMRGQVALLEGRFREAERLAEEARRVGRRPSDQDADISYRLSRFMLSRALGGVESIEDSIREAAERYSGYRSFSCLVALLDCELGQEDAAQATLERLSAHDFAAFPRDGEWLFCLSVLAEVATHVRDRGRAEALSRLLGPYRHLIALASGEAPIGSVARYVGLAALAIEAWDDAEDSFDEARKRSNALKARPWIAHVDHDHARLLLARSAEGDHDRARRMLGSALEVYRELEMKPWIARASAALEACGQVR